MDDPEIDDLDTDFEPPASRRSWMDGLRRGVRFVRVVAFPACLLLGAVFAILAGIKGMVSLSAEATARPGGYQAFFLWIAASAAVTATLTILGMREFAKAARKQAGALEYSDGADQPFYDTVTGLPTMRLFKNQLQETLGRAGRAEKLVALLLLDLEQLKVLSDRKGSASGDSALRVLSARIKGCLRGTHTLARLGVSEFGVLLESPKSIEDVSRTAEKIRQTVALPLTLQGEEILINTRIGIALHRTDGKSAEELLKRASEAKAAAKSQGEAIHLESSLRASERTEDSRLQAVPFQR